MTRKRLKKTIDEYERTIKELTANLKQFKADSFVALTLELARLKAIDAIIEDDITDEERYNMKCYNLKYISAVTEVTNMEKDISGEHAAIEAVMGAMNRQYPNSSRLYIFNKKSTYDIVKDYLYMYYVKTHPKNK